MTQMLKVLSTAGVLALSTLVTTDAFAGGHSSIKAEIQAVDSEFVAALKAGSAERLAGVYTTIGRPFRPTAPLFQGRRR